MSSAYLSATNKSKERKIIADVNEVKQNLNQIREHLRDMPSQSSGLRSHRDSHREKEPVGVLQHSRTLGGAAKKSRKSVGRVKQLREMVKYGA